MSWVANVIVTCEWDDRGVVEALSEWLRTEAPHRDGGGGAGVGYLGQLTGNGSPGWGGWKYPEACVWGGALNHADLEAVVARFEASPWTVPAAAQLLMNDQEQGYFRLWMIRDGKATQFAPPPPDDAAWL